MPKMKVKSTDPLGIDEENRKLVTLISKDVEETFGTDEFSSLQDIEEYLDGQDVDRIAAIRSEMAGLSLAEKIVHFTHLIRTSFFDAPRVNVSNVALFVNHVLNN